MEPYQDMYNYGGEGFLWNTEFSTTSCLEELQSGDEMRIYSAILDLAKTLNIAQENTITNFSVDSFVQAIVAVLNMPTYSDISSEIAGN
mmetsp:Transcript_42629/g.49856  ORF Transcript_42629/g.49856 Transcript_42629/m.49856 type:complete len:89 (+) Transcript_42629:15-281(+)